MKQTLRAIKQKTDITTQSIAELAHLEVADVFTVEVGGFASHKMALQVLTAFNQLSGMRVTLDDIMLRCGEGAK